MLRLKSLVACLLLLSILTGPLARAESVNFSSPQTEDKSPKGLRFRLSEGVEQAEKAQAAATPATTKISDSEVQSILKRLPQVKAEESDEQDFALRDKSLPPPRTGKTINVSFPATEERAQPDASATAAPLEVLRFAPEGEVPLAPQLSITFSQPMVAVTSQEEAAEVVPARLSPQPPGRWRWVGTKTLLFVPDGRFPMATQYTVTVPAGTKDGTGRTLAAAKSWTFGTPPPQVKRSHPQGESITRDALMFVEFDQRIDPAAVLRTIRVVSGGATLATRLATPEEIESDATVRQLAKSAEQGRWLVFRAVDKSGAVGSALPGDAPVNVLVGPGTPSAEGPRTTAKQQSYSFRTYGIFRAIKGECGYERECSPFESWSIEFSNPIDEASFDSSKVRVEPQIEGMKATVYGNNVTISGVKKGRTVYRVTIDRSIKDRFGQQLQGNNVFTFNVGRAPQMLYSNSDLFNVLDPTGPPRLSVYTVNHERLKVTLYSVTSGDWYKFLDYMRWVNNYNMDPKRKPQMPGRQVFSKLVSVASKPDELTETGIDLSSALDGGLGHVVAIIEPPVVQKDQERQTIHQWIQATNIGLEAFVDKTDLLGWANSLKDGRALEGVQLTIEPDSVSRGVTGRDGLARLPLPVDSKGVNLLVARQGKDVAILPENVYWWSDSGSWRRGSLSDYLSWYVFDDRKMYRPNEEVHIKGWLRRVGGGKEGDVGALNDAVAHVNYTLVDSRGNEITKGTLRLNALGGFDAKLKLPATMNLGYARLNFSAEGGKTDVSGRSFSHIFQVQEFRRPEFEVTTKASEGPLFVGQHATTTVAASYYAGGGLPNAEVRWRVTSRPTQYTPPNRGDFIFGTWIPWWISRNEDGEENSQEFSTRTDAAGKHNLRIDFDGVNPPRPSSVVAQASVTDVNRQTWTSSANMLVHPADLYVGLKSDRTFVQKGEPLNVQTIVTDLDGKAVPGREIRVRAVLLDWEYSNGEWKQIEKNGQECTVRSAAEAVKCTFQTKEGGTYRVSATVRDDRERLNESEMRLWVAGGKTIPKRDVEQEEAELIPDRKEYKPGETAEILVQSPFTPAEGVLTLRRSGIVRTERFRMDTPSMTLRIPIEEGFTPNIYAQVDLVGAATRTNDAGEPLEKLPKRPAYASGTLNLSVPPVGRRLSVEASPRERALEPGAQTVVNVQVKDAQGRPVQGSEVAVVVVDESVLALTGYKLDDPVSVFYAQRSADTRDFHLRENLRLSNPDELPTVGTGVGTGGGTGGGGAVLQTTESSMADAPPPPAAKPMARMAMKNGGLREEQDARAGADQSIRLRENFNALAVFAPSLPTDAQGRAQVEVKVPDNLTRYRVMAVSVAGGKQFGSGESAITARLPLMARPSAPRFLNFGDRFELPVVLQNQTDSAMTVSLAVRATNAELTDGAGRRVTIPANDRVEVRFPVAANKAGTARFQVGAVSGKWVDAAELSLPVWTPATTEAFATYGVIDEGAIVQPVRAPSNIFTQFGGLEISTSSTELQALTDAVLYLVSYPYECSEQLSSRILAVAALRDVLAAFKAKGLPPPEELKAAVTRDIKRLQGMQNDDGGFGFWKRGEKSWPYVSVHVAHSLQRAKEKGFDVPQEMLDKSKRYLKEIERRIPSFYSPEARRAVIAYSLYVRNRMGERDVARARRLVGEAGLEGLSMESVGWLLSVLTGDAGSQKELEAIRRHLNNRATETAGAAHFASSYRDSDYLLLNSDRRADGVILEALIADQPQSDLIPKIVRGLLGHRTRGRWENTQENVFILLALDRYFATFENVTPNFVARAWLGQRFAGEQAYRGRTTERQQVNVPMRYLSETAGEQNLTISKEGPGRLYYRIGMQYAPSNLKLEAADYGFAVERVYEAVDEASDVRRDADGTWRIKAGSRVRVRLTMAAPARRYHVALVDPMPAGLEALNPALAVTEEIPEDRQSAGQQNSYWWWYRSWFEHQNMRDERVEAFTSLLWEGVYNYSYVARATTPGNFVVPPAKAEEMYHPETFGRGKSDRVIIE